MRSGGHSAIVSHKYRGLVNHIKIMKGNFLLDSLPNTLTNSPKSRLLQSSEVERFLPNFPTLETHQVKISPLHFFLRNSLFSIRKTCYSSFNIQSSNLPYTALIQFFVLRTALPLDLADNGVNSTRKVDYAAPLISLVGCLSCWYRAVMRQ
jgi:hypothetical protein